MMAFHLSFLKAFSHFVRLPDARVGGQYQLGIGADASRGILYLLTGIIAIAAIPLLYWGARKILEHVRLRKEKSFIEELALEATRREEAGEFVSAAVAYEKMKDLQKAAELYERGGDFRKAADMYESLGQTDKVSKMHEMAGDLETAAETRMYYGDFTGAALTYNQLGDKIRAAEALENSGNMLAAVKAYREAKDYLKASSLLKEAGLQKEAADMYAISLAGSEAGISNLEKFYNYAVLLETAGDRKKAAEVFMAVSKVNPGYRDVRQKMENLAVHDDQDEREVVEEHGNEHLHEPAASEAGGKTALRNFIRAGGMEPRHSFRLWVQVLKVLEQSKKEGRLPEILTPDSIFIDSGNNVAFAGNAQKDLAYMAPEVLSGSPPDTASTVYSMGVILYEMLTGSLDAFGIKRPAEVVEEVPSWLEELTLKCCEKKRESRYQGLDEIFSAIVDLKKSQK